MSGFDEENDGLTRAERFTWNLCQYVWNFKVNEVELNCQLLKRKRQFEVQLAEEVVKRRKFEKEVKSLRSSNKK